MRWRLAGDERCSPRGRTRLVFSEVIVVSPGRSRAVITIRQLRVRLLVIRLFAKPYRQATNALHFAAHNRRAQANAAQLEFHEVKHGFSQVVAALR